MHLALKTIILNLMMEMLSLMQTGCFFCSQEQLMMAMETSPS